MTDHTTLPPEARRANRIAANFRHLPDERAAAAVADHIRRFWDPSMRARLVVLADAGHDLDPVVVAAVRRLAS
jgi:formate dehydrogenase subunit delta